MQNFSKFVTLVTNSLKVTLAKASQFLLSILGKSNNSQAYKHFLSHIYEFKSQMKLNFLSNSFGPDFFRHQLWHY